MGLYGNLSIVNGRHQDDMKQRSIAVKKNFITYHMFTLVNSVTKKISVCIAICNQFETLERSRDLKPKSVRLLFLGSLPSARSQIFSVPRHNSGSLCDS